MADSILKKVGGSFAPPLNDLPYALSLLTTLGSDAARVAKAFAGHKLNAPADFNAALCHRCQHVAEEFSHAIDSLATASPAVGAAISKQGIKP